MSRKEGKDTVEAEIARLSDLGLEDLRARWLELTGRQAPKFFRRKFLMRAVAWQLQVKTYGGLDTTTKRRLREIARGVRQGKEIAALSRIPIKPGTRLFRVWQGTTHTVTVLPQGFEWNGARYPSLSGIAKAITGTSWNGYTFFGLKQGKKAKAHSSEQAHAP